MAPSRRASPRSGVRYRGPVVAEVAEVPDDAIAEPVTCVRCSGHALLTIIGRCADCISDMGRNHPDEREIWRAELTAMIEGRGD